MKEEKKRSYEASQNRSFMSLAYFGNLVTKIKTEPWTR